MTSLVQNRKLEFRTLIAVLFLINLGLLIGNVPAIEFSFNYSAVTSGEWWRLITWPFVHISRYHFILDVSVFLLLYFSLTTKSIIRRGCLLFFVISGSLLLPLLVEPIIYQAGLSGLSGPAHGLLAVVALESIREHSNSRLGYALLSVLFIKTAYELMTGNVLFETFHIGSIGRPIVTTHAGGMLGGILGYFFQYHLPKAWPNHTSNN